MTPAKELAEKIAEINFKFWNGGDTPTSWDGCEQLFNDIESLLETALREAEERGERRNFENMARSCELEQKQGREEATLAERERSLKIIDSAIKDRTRIAQESCNSVHIRTCERMIEMAEDIAQAIRQPREEK